MSKSAAAVKSAPAAAATAPAAPSAVVTSPKVGTRWKARVALALKHLNEKFPDISKSIAIVDASLKTLDDNYAPNPNTRVDVEVGDKVTLPNHESIVKAMKTENVAEVVEVKRGKATVRFANGANFTVDKVDCRIL